MRATDEWLAEFSLIGLLWSIPHGYFNAWLPPALHGWINWATLFLAAALLFYARLSAAMFAGMLLIAALLAGGNYLLYRYAPAPLWAISLAIFAVAWVGQFWGHKLEGKKPSFLKDVQFLLIGPAWLLSFVYRRLGIRYA